MGMVEARVGAGLGGRLSKDDASAMAPQSSAILARVITSAYFDDSALMKALNWSRVTGKVS